MSYDLEKATDGKQALPKSATNSELSEEDAKRVLSSLGFMGVATALARFTLDNALAGFATKNISIIVPQGTLRVSIGLGDLGFHFGPRSRVIERPLGQIGILFGITQFVGRQLEVDVRALLRDINSDDPWEADIEIVANCFG